MTITHRGPFQGLLTTGKPVSVTPELAQKTLVFSICSSPKLPSAGSEMDRSHFKPCTRPTPSMLLALVPATQRKAIPGVLVGRNPVSIGISKDEGTPKRTIVGWCDDGGSSRFHFGMQLIDMIAVDPE